MLLDLHSSGVYQRNKFNKQALASLHLPTQKNTKITNLRCLCFMISNNLLMFNCVCFIYLFLQKPLYILVPLLPQSYIRGCLQATVFIAPSVKCNSQLLSCAFFHSSQKISLG